MNPENVLGRATYSPEDNKLRLYPAARLEKSDYLRVKAHGFIWAPKQELFVAPRWTPERADFLESIAGEIEDDDASLVDRAAIRAERFDEYSDKREADADRAHEAVAAIAGNIPLGQPILIGHHSEKHARRDAERIESGMRKAVKLWETSKYWTERAAGALRHAKYKELPDVRARRIKGIGTDLRRMQKTLDSCAAKHVFWLRDNITLAEAIAYTANDGGPRLPHKEGDRDPNFRPDAHDGLTNQWPSSYVQRTLEEVVEYARRHYAYNVAHCARWVSHYQNRIAYETAMLSEQGAAHLIAPKERPKQLPLLNYRAKEVTARRFGKLQTFPMVELTSDEYKRIYHEQRGTLEPGGTHRVRFCVYERDESGQIVRFPAFSGSKWAAVFLTDSKEHPAPDAPTPTPDPEQPLRRAVTRTAYVEPERTKFDDLKDSLKAGVKAVSAPQLFPTPPDLARRMVELADIRPGDRVLEPSAGTGRLASEIARNTGGTLLCVELNHNLAAGLNRAGYVVHQGDFLECNGDLGTFDRVVMNPPFVNGEDIKHIMHARHMLKPGGRLVALCANGPRQNKALQEIADSWEVLPDDTFAAEGTKVSCVLLTLSPVD